MKALDLLLVVLATFYAAYVLVNTHGPFGAFETARARLPHGGLLTCIYCLAVWLAVLFYVLMLTPAAIVVYPIALAGGAMLLFRYTGGNHV